jgi:hypothetical protein
MIVSLRVRLPVTAAAVAALRRIVPELPPIPAGVLLEKLRQADLVVLGELPDDRARQIVVDGRAAGLDLEARPDVLFDRELILETLRLPPFSDCAAPVIETVFYPSFAPEVVVRICGSESPALTAAAADESILYRLRCPEPWLVPPHDAPTRPMLAPYTDTGRLPTTTRSQLERRLELARQEHIPRSQRAWLVCDGVTVQLRWVSVDRVVRELEVSSPDPAMEPEQHALALSVVQLAESSTSDSRLRAALARVRAYF